MGVYPAVPAGIERTGFLAGAPAADWQKGHSSRAAAVPCHRHEDSGSLYAAIGCTTIRYPCHDHGLPGLPWLRSARHLNFCKSRGGLGAVAN
jgi:hypothetical protein